MKNVDLDEPTPCLDQCKPNETVFLLEQLENYKGKAVAWFYDIERRVLKFGERLRIGDTEDEAVIQSFQSLLG